MYLKRQGGPELPAPSNENHGNMIITITSIATALAGTLVLARLYVRAFMLKKTGIDDYVIVAGMVGSIMVLVCLVREVKLGVGEHSGSPQQTANFGGILHWSYFHVWLNVFAISSVKISVGFFLLRLVQGKWYKRFLISWIIFTAFFMLACISTLVFQCTPINAAWNHDLRFTPGKSRCFSTTTFTNIGLFNGAINIFTDFVFATLPIPMVLKLQVDLRTKITLVCILSLGYFACAAAILKEIIFSTYFTHQDVLFNDAYQIWGDIEMNVGIIAACLPALRPLFSFVVETMASLRSSDRRTRSVSGAQGRYYAQEDYKQGSMPSPTTNDKPGYGVSIAAASAQDVIKMKSLNSMSNAPTSRLEASIQQSLADNSSEENIILQVPKRRSSVASLPRDWDRNRNGGIMRTTVTEVTVSP